MIDSITSWNRCNEDGEDALSAPPVIDEMTLDEIFNGNENKNWYVLKYFLILPLRWIDPGIYFPYHNSN